MMITTKKHIVLSVLVILCLFLTGLTAMSQEGKIVTETVYSPSLEGNLFGDSPKRLVNIYLPPSYDIEPDKHYPVVYLLHGYIRDHTLWAGGRHGNILHSMKSWLKSGKVKEMIIVMPNSHNKLRGSQYTNSVTTGNWADFIAKDLVEYIDSYYRTLPQGESRTVIGHSMGAHGAVRLGLSYPQIFSSIGGMAGVYDMEDYINTYKRIWAEASTIENWSQFHSSGLSIHEALAWNAAFVPNPDNPPFYCDFPFVYSDTNPRKVVKNQEIYDRILGHDILRNLDNYLNTLLNLRGIYIYCGISDEVGLIRHARKLHEKLENLGIYHVYKEFPGGHSTEVMNHTGDALEVFSSVMAFEIVSVEPAGKLATTWGQMKRTR